jgi:hypothetical protein
MEYKDGQLLRVKVIKNEDDLPKESYYSAHMKEDSLDFNYKQRLFNNDYKDYWLENIDWYLQPIEITDVDIDAWANDHQFDDGLNNCENILIYGVKAALNDEIKHIEK